MTNVMHTPNKPEGAFNGHLNGSTNGSMRGVVAGDEGAAPTMQDGSLTEIELSSAPNSPKASSASRHTAHQMPPAAPLASSVTMGVYSPASELEDVDLDIDGEDVDLQISL